MDASTSAEAIGRHGSRAWERRLGRIGLAAAFALLLAALGLVLDRLNIAPVETFDRLIGDYRLALLSPQALRQRPDIAVVLITENTLLDYESRAPIDRGLLAEVIRAVDAAGPKAIGLDFIFDRKTRMDGSYWPPLRRRRRRWSSVRLIGACR